MSSYQRHLGPAAVTIAEAAVGMKKMRGHLQGAYRTATTTTTTASTMRGSSCEPEGSGNRAGGVMSAAATDATAAAILAAEVAKLSEDEVRGRR